MPINFHNKEETTMKKMLTLLAVLILTLSFATSALAYTDSVLEAPKAKDVVIDGDLSEWDLTKSFRCAGQNQIIDQLEHWDGEEDCAMDVSVMWDEEYLYFAVTIQDADPFVYREGFPLDELDAIIFFLSTNPDADPARTEYEATDWRWVCSVEDYYGMWFNYIDRSMIADNKGFETAGEYGDEILFGEDKADAYTETENGIAYKGNGYEAAFTRTDGGAIYEIKLALTHLSNENIPALVPAAGMTVGFDFSILDVDLPCPGIHSLRLQYSADLTVTGGRTPDLHDADNNPSLWAQLTFVD